MCVHCSTKYLHLIFLKKKKVFASDDSQKIEEKEMLFDGSVRS